MDKQTHSTLIFFQGETSNLCGFTPDFLKKRFTHGRFMVSIFQGGYLCDIDGKTDTFLFRLSDSKRNLEMGKKYIFYNKNFVFYCKILTLHAGIQAFYTKTQANNPKSRHFTISIRLFTMKLRPITLQFRSFTLNI